MEDLKHSGLPVCIDSTSNVIALSALLKYDGFSRKTVKQMQGLLADEAGLDPDEVVYDVYRGIAFPEDAELLNKNDFRYDFTVIMPGLLNGECKKTSGHYHGWNQGRTNTYPEVYEVIKGTALYILQKSGNFDDKPENMVIDDLIFVTVEEGQSVIIPPNYGHCSVNIGEGPLVFSNLAYVPCPIHYDPVKYFHGMSYYVKKGNGQIKFELNKKHVKVPEPRFASVRENPELGIKFGLPVYQSYKQNPDAFRFLSEPDDYVDSIMQMLICK